MPMVSVVMSVYNGGKYLNNAIDSILEQSYSDFEFIIINDGSTDSSWDVIQEYANKDSRIVPITQENIGLTKSLNIGIQISKGKYIARQDADDASKLDRFERQLPWLEKHGYDLCCSRTWLASKNRVSPRLLYYLPKRWMLQYHNPYIHGTYLIRKSFLEMIGGYDERFYYAQDYKLIIDLHKKRAKVRYLKEPLYITNSPAASVTLKHRDKQIEMEKKIRCLAKE